MYSNRYTLFYAVGVTTLVAVSLAVAASGLLPLQAANIARFKRIAILQGVMEVNPETLEQDYETYISEFVFDSEGNAVTDVSAFDVDVRKESKKEPGDRLYPIYVYQRSGETLYVVPASGAGLWGPISAYLALAEDLNTIHGVIFDHEKETPGLGAEITTPDFEDRFRGKQLFADDGTFASVEVLRGTGSDDDPRPHSVDGLTGATMTMNGVTRMFREELVLYEQIFRKLRS